MRWEHAFGGSSVVRNPAHAHDPKQPEFLLNEVCYSNPLGCGWIEQRHFDALRDAQQEPLVRLPAPQIEAPQQGVQQPVQTRHPDRFDAANPDEFIRIVQGYGHHPAGLGIVGRCWVPRLQLAGTFNEKWKSVRWPYLPHDYDFGYWNCAPRDQQIEALPPDARIELWNLADPAHTSDGYLRVDLPEDWPFVHIYLHDGLGLPVPMMTDTLVIDTDAMSLTLTHRVQFAEKPDIERVEAWVHRQPEPFRKPV
jgi:hypothetical protein